jgi:hypothetical protein
MISYSSMTISRCCIGCNREVDQHETNIRGHACSSLVELLSYGYDIGDSVGEAITKVGGTTGSEVLEIMQKAFEEAIVIADKHHSRWAGIQVQIYRCEYYSRHSGPKEIDKSIIYWESALQFIDDHLDRSPTYFSYERNQCKIRLSEAFFQKAVEARKNGGDPGPWVSGLRDLSSQLMSIGDQTITGGNDYASHLYGIWLRKYGSAEENVWRAYFRASIMEGIKRLSNDDPSNGYASLARTLLHTGDVDNGLATLSLTLKPLELCQAKEQQKARARHSDVESRDPGSPSSTTPEDDPSRESFISNPDN